MKHRLVLLSFALLLSPLAVFASENQNQDELNPYDPNIESKLEELDQMYGEPEADSDIDIKAFFQDTPLSCSHTGCSIYLHVSKLKQQADLYINGVYQSSFLVSSGATATPTPNFDRHPNGRIYDRYSSTAHPGGDYNGYGNMPFAVFIEGGFAVHGTPQSNWKHLGTMASHGCIRVHPENGLMFNRLVRQAGVINTWITVEP